MCVYRGGMHLLGSCVNRALYHFLPLTPVAYFPANQLWSTPPICGLYYSGLWYTHTLFYEPVPYGDCWQRDNGIKISTNKDTSVVVQPNEKHLSITIILVVKCTPSLSFLAPCYSSERSLMHDSLLWYLLLDRQGIVDVSERHALWKRHQRTQNDCLGVPHSRAYSELLLTSGASHPFRCCSLKLKQCPPVPQTARNLYPGVIDLPWMNCLKLLWSYLTVISSTDRKSSTVSNC